MQQLEFAQFSQAQANEYVVAWNETVVDSAGTHDQVELVFFNPGTRHIISQQTFQISDNEVQNLRLATLSGDKALLVYGDDTATHITEFNPDGSVYGTPVVDRTTHTFSNITVFDGGGGGRVAINYTNVIDTNPNSPTYETSQIDYKIFDMRTGPAVVDRSGLNDGQDWYQAGTHFNGDSFTGEGHGVNNTYYFVGADTAGSGPADTFNGFDDSSWNTAIFPDARSNYTIGSNGNHTVIGDPAHAGSLTIDNHVQALEFAPIVDPVPTVANNGDVVASGDGMLILGTLNKGAQIQGTATLELSGADNQLVVFDSTAGTLQLDKPSQFSGVVSGFDGNSIDFAGISHNDTAKIISSDPADSQVTLGLLNASNQVDAQINLLGEFHTQFFCHRRWARQRAGKLRSTADHEFCECCRRRLLGTPRQRIVRLRRLADPV